MSQQLEGAVIRAVVGPVTLEEQLDVAREHLFELVTDHRHFTARWLSTLKEKAGTNMDEVTLAKIIANIFGIWLVVSEHAEFVTNFILTGVPLLLFFAYPDEKAADADMLIYWPCYALVTLFDFMLQSIPAWFSLKLLLFALFFLPPWRLVGKIRLLLLAREVYMAGMEMSQKAQSSINEISQIPNEMLSQLLAAAQHSSSAQDQEEIPPASLLVPQPAPSSSTARQPVPTSSTARQPVPSSSAAARQDPSAEYVRTAEPPNNSQSGQTEFLKSHYVDLRPRSKPKLVDPLQSAYLANPHAMKTNGNGEQQ